MLLIMYRAYVSDLGAILAQATLARFVRALINALALVPRGKSSAVPSGTSRSGSTNSFAGAGHSCGSSLAAVGSSWGSTTL